MWYQGFIYLCYDLNQLRPKGMFGKDLPAPDQLKLDPNPPYVAKYI
jgi:hypothetical protein